MKTMKCKLCGKEWEEETLICPECGADQSQLPEEEQPVSEEPAEKEETAAVEPAEQEKPAGENTPVKGETNIWKIIGITVGCLLLLVGLTFAVLYGIGVDFASKPDVPQEDPTEGLKESTLGTAIRDSYSVSDEEAEAKASDVVATCGEYTLTNGELQIYYWMGVYEFLNNYSSHLSYLNLDYNKPLDQQIYDPTTGDTWEQYFLENAIECWHRYVSVEKMGKDEGYQLSQEMMANLQGLQENLEKLCDTYGYETPLELVQNDMGPAATLEGYMQYMNVYYYSMEYFGEVYDKLDPTLEEIEEYFDRNIESFEESGITKTSGKVVDVRHILVTPENPTKGEDGNMTATEEAWNEAYQQAESILKQWKDGAADEDFFAELAAKHSEDGGSSANGGLYTEVEPKKMVPVFNDWIFDETRQYGDTAILKSLSTNYCGYHIMFFVSCEEHWIRNAREAVILELSNRIVGEAAENLPMTIDYNAIVIGVVNLGAESQ